jgi:hypothetical protein
MSTLELPPSWPDTAPTEILPGLWQGGTGESSHLGMPTKADHTRGERPFDLIVTLYADAQPAPWGVEEIRHGLPGAEPDSTGLDGFGRVAVSAGCRSNSDSRFGIRREPWANRSDLVLASSRSRPAPLPKEQARSVVRPGMFRSKAWTVPESCRSRPVESGVPNTGEERFKEPRTNMTTRTHEWLGLMGDPLDGIRRIRSSPSLGGEAIWSPRHRLPR